MDASFFFLLLLLLPLFTYLLFYQFSVKKPTSVGLKAYPLIGNLPQFIQNRNRFLEWTTEIINRSPTRTVGVQNPVLFHWIMTANPCNVEYILKTKFDNFPKGELLTAPIRDFLGHGIFNVDGDAWKQQRKMASLEFSKRTLRNFVVCAVQYEIEKRLLPLLRKVGERKETIDLQDVLERFAFDNVCKVVFDEDPSCLAEQTADAKISPDFMKAFQDGQTAINLRSIAAVPFLWRLKKLLNLGSERRLKESLSIINDYAMKIIEARKEKPLPQHDDLVSRFASSKDDTVFLRDIIISFLLAGRDTTSSTLTWFFWLLSTKPQVERRILQEVKAIRNAHQNSSETFSFDELREMQYLHAAITEALRLFPPVPLDTVSCQNDDVLPDGTFVGKGWAVSYGAYAMGRSEDIWGKDCEDYQPERWLKDGVFQPESPFRFPAFHAGPRMCLGKEMAYIQMKSIAACVLEQFHINVMAAKEKPPEHALFFTLRVKDGLPIQVRKREEEIKAID